MAGGKENSQAVRGVSLKKRGGLSEKEEEEEEEEEEDEEEGGGEWVGSGWGVGVYRGRRVSGGRGLFFRGPRFPPRENGPFVKADFVREGFCSKAEGEVLPLHQISSPKPQNSEDICGS